MSVAFTVDISDAETSFSRLTADANRTGRSITVFKNNRPWVEIRPLAYEDDVPVETREAMDEADALMTDPNRVTYKSAESLFSALGL